MPRHLTRMAIDKVSLVDAGANDRRFAVLKRAEEVSKVTKTEDGKEFPAGDYAYVPDPDHPTTWKLRLTSTPGADPDPAIVGAAIAALGKGFRGQKVQIPGDDLPGVKAKVRAAWHKAHPDAEDEDVPPAIRKAEALDLEGLRSAAWAALVARDSEGHPLPLVQKRALFGEAFAAYEPVAKGLPQLSSARMKHLTQLGAALSDAALGIEQFIVGAQPKPKDVVGETEDEEDEDEETDEKKVTKETRMEPKELVEAMQPLIAEAVTKAVAEAIAKQGQGEDQITNAQLVEAVAKLLDRVEALESSRSQSLPGNDAGITKSAASKLSGIL